MIFNDVDNEIKQFLDSAEAVLALKEYKNDESREMVKTWLDHALAINRMLKYFLVKANKAKGIDPIITEALKVLLYADDAEWFKWYDALRNYLTKKPQDDAKENKLKLNFENSTLAGGWDMNKESANSCVILKNPDGEMFLGIMKKDKNTLFQKEWADGRGKNKRCFRKEVGRDN